jgi:hypothetical protein
MRTGMAIAAVLVFAVFGCAMTQEASPDATRNLTFKSSWTRSGKAPLRDGEYREPQTQGSATQLVVKLTDTAFGSVGVQEVGARYWYPNPAAVAPFTIWRCWSGRQLGEHRCGAVGRPGPHSLFEHQNGRYWWR